jgi:hypothetical protein
VSGAILHMTCTSQKKDIYNLTTFPTFFVTMVLELDQIPKCLGSYGSLDDAPRMILFSGFPFPACSPDGAATGRIS